jgi:hypothetical protein
MDDKNPKVAINENDLEQTDEAIEPAANDPSVDKAGQLARERKKAHGQTGPKTERGKSRSKMNALTHGRYAKSSVLPFEDEAEYWRHLRKVREALEPSNYVEEQIVDDYGISQWRLKRFANLDAYQRDRILDQLTPAMIANMLGLSNTYCAAAPDYLKNLKKKIPKSQVLLANAGLEQYARLMQGAQGITNFNLVWRQFPDLFNWLSKYIDRLGSTRPLFTANGKDLDIAWQQHPQEIKTYLEDLSKELFYIANFNEFKPQIRLLMEVWYFAQDVELKRLERDDRGLNAERKHSNAMLDKLSQVRKMQYQLWAAMPKELPIHGFSAPKEIDFRKD